MRSLIPQQVWAHRLVYEVIYAWPGSARATAFNVGYSPVHRSILDDPVFAANASQIQLYAELLELCSVPDRHWCNSCVLEVAAGRGGGLAYLISRYAPREAVGIDTSSVAVRRGRRRGLNMQVASAADLPFENERFDVVVCVDALNYFVEAHFVAEAQRVLKPGGRILFAETSTTAEEGRARYLRLASQGAFRLEKFRDVSDGVSRSIRERSPIVSRQIRWVPSFIRSRLMETFTLEGSERYAAWQSGGRCFAIASLQKLDGAAISAVLHRGATQVGRRPADAKNGGG